MLTAPSRAAAYSVLGHEALIDAVWEGRLAPILRRAFPGTSTQALRDARAYAYGGSLIHDLGYYPFGSRLLAELAKRKFAGISPALRRTINEHYASSSTATRETDEKLRKRERKAARYIAAMNARASNSRRALSPEP